MLLPLPHKGKWASLCFFFYSTGIRVWFCQSQGQWGHAASTRTGAATRGPEPALRPLPPQGRSSTHSPQQTTPTHTQTPPRHALAVKVEVLAIVQQQQWDGPACSLLTVESCMQKRKGRGRGVERGTQAGGWLRVGCEGLPCRPLRNTLAGRQINRWMGVASRSAQHLRTTHAQANEVTACVAVPWGRTAAPPSPLAPPLPLTPPTRRQPDAQQALALQPDQLQCAASQR